MQLGARAGVEERENTGRVYGEGVEGVRQQVGLVVDFSAESDEGNGVRGLSGTWVFGLTTEIAGFGSWQSCF